MNEHKPNNNRGEKLTDIIFRGLSVLSVVLAFLIALAVFDKIAVRKPVGLEITGVDSTYLNLINKNGVRIKTLPFKQGVKYADIGCIGCKKYVIVITKEEESDILNLIEFGHYKENKWKILQLHPDSLNNLLPEGDFVPHCNIIAIKDIKVGNFLPDTIYPGNEICILAGDPHWSSNFVAVYDDSLNEAYFKYFTFGATRPIWVDDFDGDSLAEILVGGINNTISYREKSLRSAWPRGSQYLYCVFYLDPEVISFNEGKGRNVFQAPDSIYRDIPVFQHGWYYLWVDGKGEGPDWENIEIADVDGDGKKELQLKTRIPFYINIQIDSGYVESVTLCDAYFDKPVRVGKSDLYSVRRVGGELKFDPLGVPELIKKALKREKDWLKIPYPAGGIRVAK